MQFIGSLRSIKIQLDNEAQRTQTIKIKRHVYSFPLFVCSRPYNQVEVYLIPKTLSSHNKNTTNPGSSSLTDLDFVFESLKSWNTICQVISTSCLRDRRYPVCNVATIFEQTWLRFLGFVHAGTLLTVSFQRRFR